jgi:HEAT repeat protein
MAAQNILIQIIRISEVYQYCQKELAFLECLAFDAMKMNTVIIRSSSLMKVLDELKVSSEDYPHILNIGILKGFNKQGTGTQIEPGKDYYFVHFSFQQYFAARYLAKTLKESSTETVIECIKYQKYNQSYALVFTFLSGLLSENAAKECLNIFWNNLLRKSSDLVDIRHMELVISCIGQTSDESILSRRNELSECIANCIKYRLSTGSKTIRHQLLQSLRKAQSVICQQTIINVLIDLLRCDDRLTKAGVLFFISELAILNPSNGLITSITTSLNDKNEKVRGNACKALGTMGENAATNEVIHKLVSALGDKDKNVRWYACKALGKMGRKAATDEVITKLVSALGDECAFVREKVCGVLSKLGQEMATDLVINNLLRAIEEVDEYIRENTCTILGNIGEKAATNQVIHKLLIVLEDQDENVRANACKALGKISGKSVTNKVISKLVNALHDRDQNVRANACEALGKMGEKSVTNEVISKLVSVLGDNDDDVRWNAGKALGKIGEKAPMDEVIGPLLSALRDESEYVRVYFCEVLRSLSEKSVATEVISKLVSVLEEDDDEYIRDTTHETLGTISELAAANEVIQKLVSALFDEDGDVRRRACGALGKMREKKQRQVK